MTLHLLKNPVSPVALNLLATQPTAPVVVFLSASETPSTLSPFTVYRVTERASSVNTTTISYDRLVSMLFEADRVITW